MSYITELFKYPSFISNAEPPTVINLNTIVESVRLANAGLKKHQHTGIGNDGVQIGTTGLIDQVATSFLIADYSVTTDKIDQTVGNEAVTENTIRDQAITNEKITDSAITTIKIKDNTVPTIKLQSGISNPDNQTYYGKDAAGSLGFKTLSIYGTNMDNSGNYIVLKNNATILSTITIPYATNTIQLGSQLPSYYRCTGCTWTCTGSNAMSSGKIN